MKCNEFGYDNNFNIMSNYSLMFKFIIIGDAGNCINIAVAVGKSCIVL